MRIAALLILAAAGTAAAQPSSVRPRYVAPLTFEEHELLDEGEIDDLHYVSGGALSIVAGFGIGQAVQGRWGETGFIFTLGEGVGMAALIWGGNQQDKCDSSCVHGKSLSTAGAITLVVFRLADVIEAFAAPPIHNGHVRAVKRRLAPVPYALPAEHGDGAVAGLTLRF